LEMLNTVLCINRMSLHK